MVDWQKMEAAISKGARRGLKAGALLVGMSIVASCSMFGEDSSGPAAAASDGTEPQAAETRAVGPVSDGLVGDAANARYDDSIRRRPVTTVRPLEEAPAPVVPAPTVEPRQESALEPAPAPIAAAPLPAPDTAAAPDATVSAAAAPAPVPPAVAVEAAPVRPVVAAKPSGTSPLIAESKPAPATPASDGPTPLTPDAGASTVAAAAEVPAAPAPEPAPVAAVAAVPPVQAAAPAPAPVQPMLVADTRRLDAAAAQAYGGGRFAPAVAATGTGIGGGIVTAGGPVVIGGGVTHPAMQPAVVTAPGGTVVIGGSAAPVVIGGGYGGAVAGGPSYAAPGGGEPVAVIHFDFGSTALGSRDRQVIRQVADLQARRGGFVRVVGHSSRFTANMPQDRHMLVNFETSVGRANAVAQALVREGVPPEVVETSAVGAEQPRYQEVMPAGQVGNQRVEIYLVR